MQNFIVCDLETTGINPEKCNIIEVGIVKVNNSEITDRFQSLIKPPGKLPVKIKRLTGIKDDMIYNSPSIEDISSDITNFIDNEYIVGHNISFDISFLEKNIGVSYPHYLDTLEIAKIIYPDAPGHRLSNLCNYIGIEYEDCHRALNDAVAAAELALNLINKIKKFKLATLIYLDKLLKQARSSWSLITSSIIKEKNKIIGSESIEIDFPSFFISESSNKKDKKTKIENSINAEKVKEIFDHNGPLSKQLNNFEIRPQQVEMAQNVCRALNNNKCLLMESGTGTGKTLAYLIPSLMWTKLNNKSTLVATQTINLQEQLWNKDTPILSNIFENSFSPALIKGRSNYICLKRWEDIIFQEYNHLYTDEALFFARIFVWFKHTKTGDKSELNLNKREKEIWRQLCSDAEFCQGPQCKWFSSHCFVSKARKTAENADLIITNHSLLFSDMRSDNKILPSFGPLIIDEAHHLEDIATFHLSTQVTRAALSQWLSSVYKLVNNLLQFVPPADNNKWKELISQIKQDRYKTYNKTRTFNNSLLSLKPLSQSTNITLRIKQGSSLQQILETEGNNLTTNFKTIIKTLQKLNDLLDIWNATYEIHPEYFQKISDIINSGNNIVNDLSFIVSASNEDYVYWIDINTVNSDFTILASPIQIDRLLYENLFQKKRCVVLTSATLTSNNSFEYFTERTGIKHMNSDDILPSMVPSPFDYDNQCLLCINNNLQIPCESEDYYNDITDAIEKYVTATQGQTLVLFTSHYSLKQVYYKLKDILEEMNICLLGHNIDGTRSQLIEQFKNNPRTVLLGSSSFWEGIDIPGNALINVIIIKLPFLPPNMPVVEARLEKLTRNGKNGFSNFSLPQAVIRFKQGFGRLIRNTTDAGTIIILDKRILTKKYGLTFLRSLPINYYIKGDTQQVMNNITKWLETN
ncbi:MAG: DEAD/DEAH box helicase family protein [Clostridiales bacterium]|nr:DEAD/DEAH box helicase family protein [Clostridiales bacterium]MCF8021978.1 DEAD/DEAH box helicase family protein [Clostridiales bacterium]